MESILKDWPSTKRFILLMLIAFLGLYIVISRFATNNEFNINFQNDKTLVTMIDKKNVIANSVLSASDSWINTGIEIRPGEEYQIKVSGKIHATADKLLEDVKNRVMPRFNWIGPMGSPFHYKDSIIYRESDSIRQSLLLDPKQNLGAVLFFIQKGNSKEPNCSIGNDQYIPKPNSIYASSTGLRGKNDTDEVWFVWAAVNDMLFKNMSSNESKIAFIGGKKSVKREKAWEELKKHNYNRLFFDDNFGNFVISAIITKPRGIFGF